MNRGLVGPAAGPLVAESGLHALGPANPVPQPELRAPKLAAGSTRTGPWPRSSRCASGSRSASAETEVLSWFAVDAARAREDLQAEGPYKAYLMCFGILRHVRAGNDVENWVSITDMAAGSMAAAA